MTKRIGICLLLVLLVLLLLLFIYLLRNGGRALAGDGIYFIREERNMSIEKRSLERPVTGLFGGGENVPGDREARAKFHDAAKENKG